MARARPWGHCLLALFVYFVAGGVMEAATISVPPGGDLQAALDAANAGDTIVLHPGATYVGNFVLPAKPGTSFITLQTLPDGLPGHEARISPSDAPGLAKVRSPNGAAALRTAPGAHHWRIVLIEFLANAGGSGDIIALGDWGPQNTLALVPHDLVIDRCYIHASPGSPQKRGIALNSASTTVTGSYIAEIKSDSQDSQAIAGWNGPGPFTITNNYLEAAGENVMFGGGDPAIPNLVPSDITIANNAFAKPTSWRTESWVVKNLFELKNARRVTIRDNTFDYNWQSGQSGFAILFTVRNQDGGCPWCQVEDVIFENNIVRHVAAGINILGFDDNHPSLQTRRIAIRNNLFVDMDPALWGGTGYFLQLLGGPADITVDHNTIVQDHAYGILVADGPPIHGFTFTNNLVRHGEYGFIGTDHGPGMDTINAYLPGSIIERNVIAEATAAYPADNLYPSLDQFQSQFISYSADDYRLVPGSPWRGAGTDGLDLGALPEPLTAPGALATDRDGDGKADLPIFRPSDGHWYIRLNNGAVTLDQWGLPGDVPVPGDYDGDGRMDLAVYRPPTGEWHIITSTSLSYEWGSSEDVPVPGDYDGDGKTDVAVYRPSTGVWQLRHSGAGPSVTPTTVGLGLANDIPVPADYDGDGTTDVAVYRPSTGMWMIRNSGSSTAAAVQWGLSGDVPVPGDYDGDGRSDVAVYRRAFGLWYVLQSSTGSPMPGTPVQWGLSEDTPVPSDYDGDGKTDPSVYRPSTGMWHVLHSTTSYSTSVSIQWGLDGDIPAADASLAYAIAAAATRAPVSTLANLARAGDFDNDGTADLVLYRPSTGSWFAAGSRVNFNICGSGSPGPCAEPIPTTTLGAATDIPVPGDYDGDGDAEAAVYTPASGTWTIARPTIFDTDTVAYQWGLSGDTPVPGDYDGDGKTDLAVYRPGTGEWYIRRSSTDFATFAQFQWGLPEDVPVPGDFDGDGLSDLAVWRPSSGVWYIRPSATNFTTSMSVQWGLPGDVTVPGDYDGDGKTDLAVYRPSDGVWYLLQSHTNSSTYAAYQWGVSNDIPAPSDYDGDGKTDLAVYRPSNGFWHILQSRAVFTTALAVQWGESSDIPVLAGR